MQHRAVAQACHRRGIRGIQDRLHFGSIEPVDQGLIGALLRDGAHLQGEVETARDTIFQITEEGLDRGEAVIAGADTVVAVLLQRFEEGHQERHREVLDLQGTGARFGLLRGVEDEQPAASAMPRSRTGVESRYQ